MIEKTIGRMPAPGEAVTSGTGRKNSAGTYIQENYRNRLTLAVVAEQLFVSQWHLSKLINRYTGNSFSELLNQVRIEEARKLLKDPKRRVGDIAVEVGFSDSAHFCHVFKRQIGISAGEYRNRVMKGLIDEESEEV